MQPTLSPVIADTPFRLQATPSEAIAHPAWQRARAAVLAALGRGEAAVLVGPPGTGKTLLLQDLAQALRHEGRSVRLVERGDALDPVLGTDVLLVDEAGRMDADALARLCATGTSFVLAALPDFAERLDGLARPITPVALEPLSAEEVARFVAARLSAAGRPRDMLEPDAVLALARHSAGLLRLVNVLGGAAVFLAELEEAPRVCRRHVDEAAAMRGGVDEDAAPPAPPAAEPTRAATPCVKTSLEPLTPSLRSRATAATPPTDPSLAPYVPLSAWRRRVALGAATVGLGLVLAGGWTLSGWRAAQPPGAPVDARGGTGASPRGHASSQPPGARPGDRDHAVESSRDNVGSPAPREEQAPPRQLTETSSPPRAGTAPRSRSAVSGVPVSFRGPVYNETMQQGGQMSLAISKQRPSGAIIARFEAWGGLLGSGELTGHLSADGRISASGQLMVGKNLFVCDLSGLVAGDKLTGSASFVRSGGGRVAHSRFTLTRS